MLTQVVKLVKSCSSEIEGNTLFCKDYVIKDIEALMYLEENQLLEEPLSSKRVDDVIEVVLSLVHLNAMGFYENIEAFISKNRYQSSQIEFYLFDIDKYGSDTIPLLEKHEQVLALIEAIESISKHVYHDLDIKNCIVFREDKSLFLPFIYSVKSLKSIDSGDVEILKEIVVVLNKGTSERKLIFINELIDFLNLRIEDNRFEYLLSNIKEYFNKSNSAYQFYLRDFSYNKLKIEIDSKALEYAQKIQTVINDAQTKLIAIPTAFVLVATAIDFEHIACFKNCTAIFSLFVFAILIQLFLNNQKSILGFIEGNVFTYKGTFSNANIELVSTSFSKAESELAKQKKRLCIVEFILWSIPIMLLLFWIVLVCLKSINCLGVMSFLLTTVCLN